MSHYKFNAEARCAFCNSCNLIKLETIGNCTTFSCTECEDHHTILQEDVSAFPWKHCFIVMVILVLFALWITL